MTQPETYFPRLSDMMSSYFHQDFDLHGQSEDDILSEYANTSRPNEVEAVIVELDVILARPTAGLLNFFESHVRSPDYLIAEDDGGARAWLQHARDRLAELCGQPRPN